MNTIVLASTIFIVTISASLPSPDTVVVFILTDIPSATPRPHYVEYPSAISLILVSYEFLIRQKKKKKKNKKGKEKNKGKKRGRSFGTIRD